MLDKDPQSYSIIQYGWVIGLSLWGGAVGYLQKIRQTGEKFSLSMMLSELMISSLAGILAFFICELFNITGLLAAVVIAIAGHTGGEFVTLVKDTVWARYFKKTSEKVQNDA